MQYYPHFRGAILHQRVRSDVLLSRLLLGRTVWYIPAQLACLKHAASVRPGPGSNPLKDNQRISNLERIYEFVNSKSIRYSLI